MVKNLVLLLALLGALSQVGASQFYIYKDADLKSKSGQSAKVFVGVPVIIKKDNGKEVEVEIEGLIFGDEIYTTPNKELLVAKMDKGFPVVKNGDKVKLVGTINKELISNDLTVIWGEQEEFYYEMCTQCHAGKTISHHSMLEWGALFAGMKGFAKLSEEESVYLLRYLVGNASDGFVKVKH